MPLTPVGDPDYVQVARWVLRTGFRGAPVEHHPALLSVGAQAAWEADLSFDPERGRGRFSFCCYRSRHAMTDEWRRIYGRRFTSDISQLHDSIRRPLPLEEWDSGDGTDFVTDLVEADAVPAREHLALQKLGELPEQEAEVVLLTFLHGWTLREVAEMWGVVESRVSQVRTKALSRLRGTRPMDHRGGLNCHKCGRPYAGENLRVDRAGRRYCRHCQNSRHLRR